MPGHLLDQTGICIRRSTTLLRLPSDSVISCYVHALQLYRAGKSDGAVSDKVLSCHLNLKDRKKITESDELLLPGFRAPS